MFIYWMLYVLEKLLLQPLINDHWWSLATNISQLHNQPWWPIMFDWQSRRSIVLTINFGSSWPLPPKLLIIFTVDNQSSWSLVIYNFECYYHQVKILIDGDQSLPWSQVKIDDLSIVISSINEILIYW